VGRLIPVDGIDGACAATALRTALALSAATGQGFETRKIRASEIRTGLLPQDLSVIRALTMATQARVGGVFEGSPDLRFEPGAIGAGQFDFDIGTAGTVVDVVQAMAPVLAGSAEESVVRIFGSTHAPSGRSAHFLERHWAALLSPAGLDLRCAVQKVGFYPKGGGEMTVRVQPRRPAGPIELTDRGPLRAIRGIALACRLKGDVARRMSHTARGVLWEQRRLESQWTTLDAPGATPGSFIQMELVFERSRAAFGLLGSRGVRADVLAARLARTCLQFLEGEGAVDPASAEQLLLPAALAGTTARVSTSEITPDLEASVAMAGHFGVVARCWGRSGGAGGFLIERP
jgi:RNA 3'-terminal phosphate cyclase (ATP)